MFSSYEQYVKLHQFLSQLTKVCSAKIITKESGLIDYWVDWADKGLFAFDYQDVHRNEKFDRYDLMAAPSQPLLGEIIQQFHEFQGVVARFNVAFSGDILFSQLKELEI